MRKSKLVNKFVEQAGQQYPATLFDFDEEEKKGLSFDVDKAFALVKNEMIRGRYFTTNVGKRLINYVIARYFLNGATGDTITFELSDFLKDMCLDERKYSTDTELFRLLSSFTKKDFFIFERETSTGEIKTYYPFVVSIDHSAKYISFKFIEESMNIIKSVYDAKNPLTYMTPVPLLSTKVIKSYYTQRLFEYILSHKSQMGNGTNEYGCWFVKINIEAYKKIVLKSDTVYSKNSDFVRRVITEPINEINKKISDFSIVETKYIKTGNKTTGVILQMQVKNFDKSTVLPPYFKLMKNVKLYSEENLNKYFDLIKKNYAMFLNIAQEVNKNERYNFNLNEINKLDINHEKWSEAKQFIIEIISNFRVELDLHF